MQRPRERDRIGPFELRKEISASPRSWVFEAVSSSRPGSWILKLAAPENRRSRLRFLRETALLTSLASPHVVPVLGSGEVGGFLWMMMPFMAAADLFQWSQGLPPPGPGRTGRGLPVLRDVLAGLTEIHALTVLHRDLTPGNVLVDGDGRARIADLGLARGERDEMLTSSGALLGTPAFVSPEMITGRKLDVRSDLYQWALLAHWLLAGALPLGEDRGLLDAARRCREPVPPLTALVPGIPGGISDLVERNLAVDPDLRHQAAREILEDLHRLPGGSGRRADMVS